MQEKLASLDCDKNYVLKVTSIKDNVTSDGVVEIHKKDTGKSQSKTQRIFLNNFLSLLALPICFFLFFLREKSVGFNLSILQAFKRSKETFY